MTTKGAHHPFPELCCSRARLNMTKPNPKNEIIKREYFRYLREAGGRNSATIDCVAKSLTRFEESTNRRDFKRFHREQAVAFKARLRDAVNARTGERLSKATVLSALRDLRAFFIWLAREPGYKSHIAYSDADYFNLADKDVAVARARREPKPPTPEQMRRVLNAMPAATVLERRDRAVVAFAAVTGARVRALTTFPLGAVDPSLGTVEHDARLVRTKGGKTFRSDFHRVVPGAAEIVVDWCAELAECHGWGRSDPLFPQNDMGLDENGGFVAIGLARKGWATSDRCAPSSSAPSRRPASTIITRIASVVAGPPLYGDEPDPRADEGGFAKPWSCRYYDDFLQLRANTDATAERADLRDRCGTCRY